MARRAGGSEEPLATGGLFYSGCSDH